MLFTLHFPHTKKNARSRRRSYDLRPLIDPHVRISRMRLSFQALGKFDQNVSQYPFAGSEINPLFPPTSNKLFQYTDHFGNRRRVFLLSLLSPISYLICASVSPIGRCRQSRIPSHSRRFILQAVTSRSQAPTSSLLCNLF